MDRSWPCSGRNTRRIASPRNIRNGAKDLSYLRPRTKPPLPRERFSPAAKSGGTEPRNHGHLEDIDFAETALPDKGDGAHR